MEQELERHLAAILALDIAGYSRLMSADEPGTLARLLRRRQTILDPLVEQHRGRVVKGTGDGILAEFASAQNAIRAAQAMQTALAAANAAEADAPPMVARIGITIGDIFFGPDGDIFGDGVNIASRLESEAPAGGICVSDRLLDDLRRVGAPFTDFGEITLKNIAHPVRVYCIAPDGVTLPARAKSRAGVNRRLLLAGGGATAVALAGASSWWALQRGSAPGDSVAVLPFANLSGDPAQAYFSDGIAEELRDALTRIAGLKVAGRSSSELMRDVDGPTAAAKLGVANILSGTVRRGAGLIRINAELIDGISGLARWSQAYDRPIGDALAIQTGIAESVAGALSIALGKAQKALLTAGATSNPAAQDAFLRGTEFARKNNLEPALKDFDAAIAADPNFAKAYSSRAGARAAMAGNTLGGSALRAALTQAEADARRSIALAPGLGRTYSALGFVLKSRVDLNGAQRAYDAAYAASPDDPIVLRTRADMLASLGDQAAVDLYRRAEALDPLRSRNAVNRAQMQVNLGRFDDAIASARSFLAEKPGDAVAAAALGTALLAKGQPGEALKAVAALPANEPTRLTIEAASAAATDRAASDRALATLSAKYADAGQYQIAEVHAWRREPDPAFAALARAWDGLDPGLVSLKTDPLFAPIRSDPRFGEWLRKIGFP